MTELTDEKFADTDGPSRRPCHVMWGRRASGMMATPIPKWFLPDGRLVAVPSRARMGSAGVTWIRDDEQKIFEYETGGTVYSVGAVDGEPTVR